MEDDFEKLNELQAEYNRRIEMCKKAILICLDCRNEFFNGEMNLDDAKFDQEASYLESDNHGVTFFPWRFRLRFGDEPTGGGQEVFLSFSKRNA